MARGPRQQIYSLSIALGLLAGFGSAPFTAQDAQPANKADLESTPDFSLILAAGLAAHSRDLSPGLSYGSIEVPRYGLTIHVWTFDLKRFRLRTAQQTVEKGNRIEDFITEPNDVFAVNGGYFEKDDGDRLSASGLLIVGGKEVATEHDRAGSGLIYSNAAGVAIDYRQHVTNRKDLSSALQAGPILVEPGGKIGIRSSTKDKRYNRSAICLRDERIAAIVVEGGLTLLDLARLLSTPASLGGIGCKIAINLDGGGSTQAVFRGGGTRLLVPGKTPVHNALIFSTK